MKIGICDDEPMIVKILVPFIEESLEQRKVKAEIIPFLSGYGLLEKVNELDAVFLDISMPEMDGFEVGFNVNQRNPFCKIIMATGNTQRYKDAFKINAFRFITKPFDPAEIDEAVEALLKMKIGEERIRLYYERIPYDMPQRVIAYWKAYNGYCEAKVQDKNFRRELSLNEVEGLLDDRLFVRIHKQYIVNMQYIDHYKNHTIAISGEFLPVSRRKQKEFEARYLYFDVNHRR
jgi:DNA-binding LytR/AlgR family response regulator